MQKNIYAFGNMSDQRSLGPKNVVSSAVWNMTPTVEYVLRQVRAHVYTAQDLKDFSMMGDGGARLAPINTAAKGGIPAKVVARVRAIRAKITSGALRVDIDEGQPAGSITVKK